MACQFTQFTLSPSTTSAAPQTTFSTQPVPSITSVHDACAASGRRVDRARGRFRGRRGLPSRRGVGLTGFGDVTLPIVGRTKRQRHVQRFADHIAVGDPVAVPVEDGLLVGTVVGAYEHRSAPASPGLHHRRNARWLGVRSRDLVPQRAALQDPQSVFAVYGPPLAHRGARLSRIRPESCRT
ncbi:MAG: hypothetical protein M3O86_00690 [Actinomycetota bacterium]|nr:hypothetical protein [Actinomycetota bacterium]